MKHLLKMLDLSKEEILDILNLADQLKYENKNGIEHHILKGKTLGMIFRSPLPIQEFLLKQVCISLAVRHFSFQTVTSR